MVVQIALPHPTGPFICIILPPRMRFKIGPGIVPKKSPKLKILISQTPFKYHSRDLPIRGTRKTYLFDDFQLFFHKFCMPRPLILSPWPVFRDVFQKSDLGLYENGTFKKLGKNVSKNGPNPWNKKMRNNILFYDVDFWRLGSQFLEDLGPRNCTQFAFWPTFYAPGNHFGRFVGPLSSVLDDFGANCEESGRARARPNGILESQKHNLETLEMH